MAEPFSTIVGSLQIAGQCAAATIALAKWINQVATVDQRIKHFYEDIERLEKTYSSLEQSSNSPAVLAAAKTADETTEHLWTHLRTTLHDCQNTLVAINHVLYRINSPLGLSAHLRQFWTSPIRQLQEQLYAGELGRHHEKIKMFNNSLTLPMQMIQITLQLDQRDLSREYHRSLEDRLVEMQGTIHKLNSNIVKLQSPSSLQRVRTSGANTLVEEQNGEKVVCQNMEHFARSAKQFLSNASSIASSRSGGSTINQNHTLVLINPSEGGIPLTQRHRNRIDAWVPPFKDESAPSVGESDDAPSSANNYNSDDSDDEDSKLDEVRTYFKHGQSYLTQGDFPAAEENFVEALEVLQTNDFGERIAFQSADVVLMLAHCLVEQDKVDEAIELLLPLIENNMVEENPDPSGRSVQSPNLNNSATRPDLGRTYAAHHSIGNVYLKKQDYENAVKHGTLAYNGRKKFFGKGHEKTIETVQLVIDAYRAMGKRARAERWETLLVPKTDSQRSPPQSSRRLSNNVQVGNATAPRPSISSQPTLTIAAPPLNTILTRRISNDFYGTNSPTTHVTQASVFDETRTISSVTAGSSSIQQVTTSKLKHDLKSRFDAVRILAKASKDRAWNETKEILRSYDPQPSKILTVRSAELEKNIKKQGLAKGMSATGFGYAPIHFFCDLKTEYPTEVEILIENGADLMSPCYRAGYGKQEPKTPLQLAIANNHQTLAVMILDALQTSGVSVTQILALKDLEDFSPFLLACRLGQVETVIRFLEFGAAVTSGFPQHWRGNSLLHDAASRCDTDMVNLLLSIRTERNRQRPDIGTLDLQDQFGRTPFMYAVISKNIPDQPKRDRKVSRRLKCVEAMLGQAGPELGELFAVQDHARRDVWSYARDEGDGMLDALLGRYAGGVGGGNVRDY